MTSGWRRLLRIFGRDAARDIDAELRFHMEERVEDLAARGATPDAAHRQALAEFGDIDATRAHLSTIDARIAARSRRAQWWEGIAQDLRHTLRGLVRSPGFTVMVVVTLALGIGANAAVFSVLNQFFPRTPPGVTTPSQVRRLVVNAMRSRTGKSWARDGFSYSEYNDVAASVPGAALAAFTQETDHLGAVGATPSVNVVYVLGNYFGVLGVRVVTGRGFRPEELTMSARTPVVVISDALWHARFARVASILDSSLTLGVHRYTIVGVAPAGFRGTELNAADVWVPLNAQGSWKPDGQRLADLQFESFLQVVARVPTPADAARLITGATAAFRQSQLVHDTLATSELTALTAGLSPGDQRQSMVATRLAGVAAIILLLACANVANLLLTRGMRRRREVAIRLALGVSRRRLVTQLMVEIAIIAALAGGAALVVAVWAAGGLRHALLPDITWAGSVLDGRMAAFTAAVACFTAFAAGLVPALQSARPDVNASLKAGGSGGSQSKSRMRSTLIVVQAALSVVLLAGAGVFVRSLQAVKHIDIGYNTEQTILASARYDVDAEPAGGDPGARLLPEIAERLRHAPGVQAVALAQLPPLASISILRVFLPDRDSVPQTEPLVSQVVGPGFFDAAGIPLLSGRSFTVADRAGSEQVMVVNQSMARAFWPGERAVGKCVIVKSRSAECRQVVGVVGDEHIANLVEGGSMQFFLPLAQGPGNQDAGQIVLRAAPGQVNLVVAEARRAITAAFGPGAMPQVRALRDIVDPQLRPWRLGAALFSAAGLLAALVAAVGMYSAMSYGVSQRRREMGIRLALGARPQNLTWLVVGHGVRVVAVGVVIGILASLALGPLVASLLYGTSPRDPLVLTCAAVGLLVVAVVAGLVPARRAARVDPMETLRQE